MPSVAASYNSRMASFAPVAGEADSDSAVRCSDVLCVSPLRRTISGCSVCSGWARGNSVERDELLLRIGTVLHLMRELAALPSSNNQQENDIRLKRKHALGETWRALMDRWRHVQAEDPEAE